MQGGLSEPVIERYLARLTAVGALLCHALACALQNEYGRTFQKYFQIS